MSSAGVELATRVSALVGAVVAMRRSRRAQRTIARLDALALRRPINSAPLAVLGALLGALTYRQFGFSLEMVAYGLMIAMCRYARYGLSFVRRRLVVLYCPLRMLDTLTK